MLAYVGGQCASYAANETRNAFPGLSLMPACAPASVPLLSRRAPRCNKKKPGAYLYGWGRSRASVASAGTKKASSGPPDQFDCGEVLRGGAG